MPVEHLILLKLKPGVTETQINSLCDAFMSLASLPMVQNVACGENYSNRSQGFNFGVRMTLTDLTAYQNDPKHIQVRDTLITPLVVDGGFLVVDFDFPRNIAIHGIGKEVATPDQQHWDLKRCNEDLAVVHNTISPKSDASIWRCAVAARPIRGHAYAEFVIDLNPKPANRTIQIGVLTRGDLDGIEAPGKNFTDFKTGIAWTSNGGLASGFDHQHGDNFPRVPWEHDHTVGVLVDLDKDGTVQFFYDRKKVGPVLKVKELGHEAFFCVSIDSAKTAIKANWTASPPKVFLA
jgi:hypothetical protein